MNLALLQELADEMPEIALMASNLADKFREAAEKLTAATVGTGIEDADRVKITYSSLQDGKERAELLEKCAMENNDRLDEMIGGIQAALNG